MKSLLEKVNGIDDLLRHLHKIESKLRAGQIIEGWREINRMIAFLSTEKQNLIKSFEDKDAK